AIRYGARFEDTSAWKLAHLVISYPKVAKLVFENGGNPDIPLAKIAPGFKTANVDTLRFLVEECGADVNGRNQEGFTALASAASGGKIDFAQYLLDHGAEVKPDGPDWQKPLHIAETLGHNEIAEMLRKRGAK